MLPDGHDIALGMADDGKTPLKAGLYLKFANFMVLQPDVVKQEACRYKTLKITLKRTL